MLVQKKYLGIGDTYNYSYSPGNVPQKFWIHFYLEPGELKSASLSITQPKGGNYIKTCKYRSSTSDGSVDAWYLEVRTGKSFLDTNAVMGYVYVELKDEDIAATGIEIDLTITSTKLSNARVIKVFISSCTEAAEKAKEREKELKAETEHNEKLKTAQPQPNESGSVTDIAYFVTADLTVNGNTSKAEINKIEDKALLEKWIETLTNATPDKYGRFTEEQIKVVKDAIQARLDQINGVGEGITDAHVTDAQTILLESEKLLRSLSSGGVIGSRPPTTFEDVLENIGDYKPTDLDEDTSNKVEGIITTILTMITDIGMIIAVIIIAILGIKYMLGSVEEKAEYKKDMVAYLVGAGLLFGILAITKVLMQWGNQITNL